VRCRRFVRWLWVREGGAWTPCAWCLAYPWRWLSLTALCSSCTAGCCSRPCNQTKQHFILVLNIHLTKKQYSLKYNQTCPALSLKTICFIKATNLICVALFNASLSEVTSL
jgi:hypothetical protein